MSRGRFKREKKLVALSFDEDTGLEGFECIMRSVSLEKLLNISRLTTAIESATGRTPENVDQLFSTLGGLLEEWNLDDADDQPVPCTYASLKQQDLEFAQAILAGYMQALASVPKVHSSVSADGGQLPEESTLGLGMHLPSPSS